MRKFKIVQDKVYIPKIFRKYKKIDILEIAFIYIGCLYLKGGYHKLNKSYVPYIAILTDMNICNKIVNYLGDWGRNELLWCQRYDEETFLQLLENGFNGRICVWHEIYNDNFLEPWTQLAREGKLDMEKVQLIFDITIIY